jgi:hypothetical protein
VADAVLDALVVAKLEVQARQFDRRAPVAAVQRFGVAIADGRGDRGFIHERDENHQPAAQQGACLDEEFGGEGRVVAVADKGIAILAVDRQCHSAVDLVAMADFQPQAGLGTARRSRLSFLRLSAVKPARKSSKSL